MCVCFAVKMVNADVIMDKLNNNDIRTSHVRENLHGEFLFIKSI